MTNKRRPEETKNRKVTEHHGLCNQGATCYLNSVLQVLFMTQEIHSRLCHGLDGTPHSIDGELTSLFRALEHSPCNTKRITESLGIENVFEQRDAAECLEQILQKVNPKVSEVFQGQLTETTTCSRGHVVIEETSPFWSLPLSLRTEEGALYSVERGFEKMFQNKSLHGDNKVYCRECKEKTEATSTCKMLDFPQILVLLLKRFEFNYVTMSDVKSQRCVDVPLVLHAEEKTYRLYGMVGHVGNLRGGHYTATTRSKDDGTWYQFDDDYVQKVEEQPFANLKSYKSTTAYLLTYRRAAHRTQGSYSRAMAEEGQRSKKEEDQSCSCWWRWRCIKTTCGWFLRKRSIRLALFGCMCLMLIIWIGGKIQGGWTAKLSSSLFRSE